MPVDAISYLNGSEASPMSGSLDAALASLPAKMVRAPAKEWEAALKGLVSRGLVKQPEIDDSEILSWFATQPAGTIEREAVMAAASKRRITIKEVALGRPQYQGFSHMGLAPAGANYRETLYLANAEVDNVEDRIEEIDWEMEQYNFDIMRLSENPEGLFALAAERKQLMIKKPVSHEFSWVHFQSQDKARLGKNLIAHSREMTWGNTFLVSEIQSDWGQRGRMRDWAGIPRGPFVTDTKLWAGLVMRRLMQRAALNPAVERFYWIRGSMRNGGLQVTKDNLDEFYLKTVGGIVDRVLAPAKQKCRLETLRIGDSVFADVPCFDMTPEVRERLKQVLPLYSLSQLLPKPRPLDDRQVQSMLKAAQNMTGSVKSIRLVDHLYDVALGREVAGSYVNGLVQASLRARDLPEVLNHECFHFGMDKLFTDSERQMVKRAFAPGTELNNRVKDVLLRANDRSAWQQCSDPEEAAAYGFAYWSAGKLELEPSPVKSLFQEMRVLAGDVLAWFRKTAMEEKATTPKELFEAFSKGEYAQYAPAKEQAFRAPEVRRTEAVPRE